MANAAFLEIDESLKMKNLILPDKERDALDHQMEELMKQFDSTASILVQPSPGICVKTKATSGEKIFVNICVSDKIPAPEDISDAKLLELLDDDEPAYTIPMSIGAERMEVDKSGVPCATYDVMLNTTYLKKCQEKKLFMAFTMLVILNGLADKFNKEFNTEDYVILKNRTVMGKLQQHRLRSREEPKKPQAYKPLIEEISAKSVNKKIHSRGDDKVKAGYVILKEPCEGPPTRLIALFDMPKSVSAEDVVVLINSDCINVTDEKASSSYEVVLPYNLKMDNAEAHFDCDLRVLRVDVLI